MTLIKTTELELHDNDGFSRSLKMIETKGDMQLQIEQDGDEAFIDLEFDEIEDLSKELNRFVIERRKGAQTPLFNPNAELYPFYKLVCERDVNKAQSDFPQIKEIGYHLASIIAEDYTTIGIITVAKYMMNRTLIGEKYYQKRIVPIIQKLCELDSKKKEENFGQMSELLKVISIIFEEHPTYLAAMIRYSVHLSK